MSRPVVNLCCSYVKELEDPTPFLVCGLSKLLHLEANIRAKHCKLMIDGTRVIAIAFYDLSKHELFDVTDKDNVHKLPYILEDCSDWPGSTFTCTHSKISDGHRIWNARTGRLIATKTHKALSNNGKNILCCTNRGREDYYHIVVDIDTSTTLATIENELVEAANGIAVFCKERDNKYQYLVYDLDIPKSLSIKVHHTMNIIKFLLVTGALPEYLSMNQ